MLKRIVHFLVLLVVALSMFILSDFRLHITITAVLFIITLFIKTIPAVKEWQTSFEIIAIYFALVLVYQLTGLYRVFFLTHIITLVVFYVYIVLLRKYKPVRSILIKGKLRGSLLPAIIFALVSIAFLVFWFINQDGNPHAQYLPDLAPVLLLPLGIGFALLNGLFEEGIFRGLLFPAFEKAMGFVPALIMQAVWFSFLHYQAGFPSGVIGIGLTFVFAIMMAVLLKRTGGIVLPVLVHALADFCIFIMIWSRSQSII